MSSDKGMSAALPTAAAPTAKEAQPANLLVKPQTITLVYGTTGAGKSQLINAVVGEEVLPIGSDLYSCTPYPIKLTSQKEKRFDIVFTFLSQEEWQNRRADLLNVFHTEDVKGDSEGGLDNGQKEDHSEHMEFCRIAIKSLYPNYFEPLSDKGETDQVKKALLKGSLLISCPTAHQTSRTLFLMSAAAARKKEEGRLTDEDNALLTQDMALWPLVKSVQISGPFPFLQEDTILADTPGIDDVYMRTDDAVFKLREQCTNLWFAIPASRNIGSTNELKRWLRSVHNDGLLNEVTLVVTQADSNEKFTTERKTNVDQLENIFKKSLLEEIGHYNWKPEIVITSSKAFSKLKAKPGKKNSKFSTEEQTGIPYLRNLLKRKIENLVHEARVLMSLCKKVHEPEEVKALTLLLTNLTDMFNRKQQDLPEPNQQKIFQAVFTPLESRKFNTIQCICRNNGRFRSYNFAQVIADEINNLVHWGKFFDAVYKLLTEMQHLDPKHLKAIESCLLHVRRSFDYRIITSIETHSAKFHLFVESSGKGCRKEMLLHFENEFRQHGAAIINEVLHDVKELLASALHSLEELITVARADIVHHI